MEVQVCGCVVRDDIEKEGDETQNAIMEIFMDLVRNQNKCIILVTHSPEVEKMVDVTYELSKN